MLRTYGTDLATPFSPGQHVQTEVPAAVHGIVTPVPGNGNSVSNVIESYGYPGLTVGVTSDQAGQISVQRYADRAGTIPVGAAVTASLTANTAASASVADGKPFQSFTVTISDSSGTPANLTGLIILLGG